MYIYIYKCKDKINQIQTNAVHTAKTTPPRLQGVQEGDAQVLLKARFDKAHGHPANAGAVLERNETWSRDTTKTNGRLIPHAVHVIIDRANPRQLEAPPNDGAFTNC